MVGNHSSRVLGARRLTLEVLVPRVFELYLSVSIKTLDQGKFNFFKDSGIRRLTCFLKCWRGVSQSLEFYTTLDNLRYGRVTLSSAYVFKPMLPQDYGKATHSPVVSAFVSEGGHLTREGLQIRSS